jgi:hypothetical protein
MDYWWARHGETEPSPQVAGMLAARLAHIERNAATLIGAIEQETPISHSAYPAASVPCVITRRLGSWSRRPTIRWIDALAR